MAVKKWWRLTPRQIAQLDKDKTLFIFPLGTIGSLDDGTAVWADYRAVEDDAQRVAETIDSADEGPLVGLQAVLLLPLWPGVEPGPDQPGTLALPQATYAGVVEATCSSLKRQGVRFLLLVVRDEGVEAAAGAVAQGLNQGQPRPWVAVYNALRKPPPASMGGDVCRKVCQLLGCNPANCPP